MKVLIVDDSMTMRKFLSAIVENLLSENGIVVEQAADGEQGLLCLERSGPFDLALVDWDMPGMNGLSFVERVRGRPEFRSVKLMMVTGRTAQEAVVEAVSMGADDFLMKPLTPGMVADKFRILGLLD